MNSYGEERKFGESPAEVVLFLTTKGRPEVTGAAGLLRVGKEHPRI